LKIGVLQGWVSIRHSRRKARFPPIIFARIDTPINASITTLLLTVFTQRNFVADYLQAKCDFRWKTAVLHFGAPFGGLGTTYDVHLRLIEKLVVDFLLVLTELFARCYR